MSVASFGSLQFILCEILVSVMVVIGNKLCYQSGLVSRRLAYCIKYCYSTIMLLLQFIAHNIDSV